MTDKPQRSTPLQNKVDPWGQLHALRFRGTLMGNRGILHDEHDQIYRQWDGKRWLTCSLDESFQIREPFTQGTYSELFFLDEATAYAAGHRPCQACQREKHAHFNAMWTAANMPDSAVATGPRLPISQIDAALHAERVGRDKKKRTYPTRLGDLPVGAMFVYDNSALLVGPAGLLRWSFEGYQPNDALAPDSSVALLTPPSIVAAIRHGLTVELHPSAYM